MGTPRERQRRREASARRNSDVDITAVLRPTDAQRRYLERGLMEPGGKLPLFDRDGREVPKKTIQSCIVHGWAEPWVANPIKPDWLVCRLTAAGVRALGAADRGR
jgi:hypothetical protein